MGEDRTNTDKTVLSTCCFTEHLCPPVRLPGAYLAQDVRETFMAEVLLKDSFSLWQRIAKACHFM